MWADVDGRRIHWEEAGAGRPVLLIHGLGGTGSFSRVVPLLGRHFRVLVPSLAGFGPSPRGAEPLRVEGWGQDLLALLETARAKPALVVGHSLGGMVAQWLAARAPEAVAGLVLVNTFVDSPPERVAALRARAEAARTRGMEAILELTAPLLFGHHGNPAPVELVEPYARSLRELDPESYAQACEALAAFSGRPLLPLLRCPTRIVSGVHDAASPPAVNEELQRSIPGARLLILEGCGHLLPLEAPERLAEEIRSLADEVWDGRP